MSAWQALDESEQVTVWKQIHATFGFDPVLDGAKSQFHAPEPNATIDLFVYEEASDIEQLNAKILAALRLCTTENERLYLLDPYHLQGWFIPHHERAQRALLEYQGGFYANDEYKLCLSGDFSFGFLVNGLKRTVTVFGEFLLQAISEAGVV